MPIGNHECPVGGRTDVRPNLAETVRWSGSTGAPVLSPASGRGHSVGRRGAAALEFAVAFPIFLLLVFCLIEASRAMMVISLLNNAARVGCREAILPTATPESVENVVDEMLNKQGVHGHTTTVLVNNQVVSMDTASQNELMTVRISVPISRVSWTPGLNLLSGNLQGQYILPRE
jgi:Flp pilus assembly protein TadG